MATFNPYNKAIKESINVDFKDRHSPQKVILCNRENQFYGEFIGTIKGNGIDLNGGKISNVELSNVSIYDDEGNLVHLSSLAKDLTNIKADIHYISSEAIPSVWLAIEGLSGNISSLNDGLEDISALAENVSADLVAERAQRAKDDSEIRGLVENEFDSLHRTDAKISSELVAHIGKQITDLQNLSTELISEFNVLKHYEIGYASTADEFTKGFELKDFRSNIVNTKVPYAYVRLSDDVVGKIINVETEGSDIAQFDFVVFDGCPRKELVPRTYFFDRSTVSVDTGYHNYCLKWDRSSPDDMFKMLLVGNEEHRYFDTEFVDGDGETKNAGRVVDFLSSGDDLISGVIRFDTAGTLNLTGFNNLVFRFSDEENSKVYDNCPDGITRKVIYDRASKKFTLRDNFDIAFYQSLSDGTEFGRIYQGGVEYDDGIKSISVDLSTKINDEDIVGKFVLDRDSGFKTFVDDKFNYVKYDGSDIVLAHQSIHYKTVLSGFNTLNGTILSDVVGELKFDSENFDNISDTRITSFTLSVSLGGELSVINGTYQLVQSDYTESSKNVYTYRGRVDDGTIFFRYDSNYDKNILKYVYTAEKTTVGYFFVDASQSLEIADQNDVDIYRDSLETEDGEVVFPCEDSKETVDYEVSCIMVEKKEEGDKRYDLESFSEIPEINVYVPENKNGRAREFIVVFNIETPENPKFDGKYTKVNLRHEDDSASEIPDYQFVLDGFDVTKKLYLVKNKSVLKFTEVQTNKFAIEDMYNTSLINYINERFRGGVNYRGVVQVVDFGEYETNNVSSLFYRSPDSQLVISGEWKYPRPEYVNMNCQLFNGNLFYVKGTEHTETTKWVVEGVELEAGDYIIVNKDKKIFEITSADIDVIDAIEKDHIVVDRLTVREFAQISTLQVDSLSAESSTTNSAETRTLTVSISADIDSEKVQNSKITNLSADDANLNNTKIKGLSSVNATISSETVLTSNISVLTADTANISSEIVQNSKILNLEVDKISVELGKLYLKTGSSISSASEISSEFDKRIEENKKDISSVSSDLSSLSADYSDTKNKFNNTFWGSLSGDPWPGDDVVPQFLLLRDQVLTGNIYVLEIRNGVLAYKLMKETH